MNGGRPRILVVDDEIGREGDHQAEFFKRSAHPTECVAFCTGQETDGRNRADVAIERTRLLWECEAARRIALVLLDVRFRDTEDEDSGARFGFSLLTALRERFGRTLPIVMLTSVSEARGEANASQADGFLPKEELTAESLAAQLLRNGLYPESGAGLTGTAVSFLVTLRELRRVVAAGMRELLLLGESGTGKSELARYVHRTSGRAGRFEPWFGRRSNSELHYDQLFGHWKGAFDGAREHRAGAAERAHKGTLFLDEIAELGAATQADFLEYRQAGPDGLRRVRRLGIAPDAMRRGESRAVDLWGTYSPEEDRILVDTTIVSATNRPIDDEAWREQIGFRGDLFNRLGHRVRLPPLRDRVDDIALLFLEKAKGAGRSLVLMPSARAALEAHEWREGNIAELRVVAEAVVAKLGPDFNEVHTQHLEGLLGSRPIERDQATPPGAARTHEREGARPADAESFIEVEVRCLWSRAEFLRSAVIDTRRPTGLGSLADILKQATGVQYAPTDVKREVKSILEGWFAPNVRQEARWQMHPDYTRQAAQIRRDGVLASLYSYATGEISWDAAKERIIEVLDR